MLQFLLSSSPALTLGNSFLLQLTLLSYSLEDAVKGNGFGAMWEEMLVVNTSEEEAAWERWEAKLM